MSDYDFKGALVNSKHVITLANEGDKTNKRFEFSALEAEQFLRTHGKSIQAALRLAKRMQSGHVSNAMIWAVKDNDAGDVAVFHAMTAQLMKEVKDEH